MSPDADTPPGDPNPVDVLAGRLRFASAIALAALPIFAAADLWGNARLTNRILLVKLAQLVLVIWTYRAASRARSWEQVRRVTLVFVSGLIVTACAAATARPDLGALPLLLVVAVITPAVMVPYGRCSGQAQGWS